MNDLKKRGYESYFEDVDDSTGIKSAKGKIESLINESIENKQFVESDVAKKSIESTEQEYREINLSNDSDSSDSSDDSYEASRSRDSAPSPPSCNDAAENNRNKDFLSDNNNKEFVSKSPEAVPDQKTDGFLDSIFSDF